MGAYIEYIKLGAVAVLLVLVAVFTHRYDAGQEAERNLANARQYAQALSVANQNRLDAEARHTADSAATAEASRQLLKEHDDAANKTIAALRAGTLGLRLPTYGAIGSGTMSKVTTDPAGVDRARTDEWLGRLAEDMAQRLAVADEVAGKLNWCEQELVNDRK